MPQIYQFSSVLSSQGHSLSTDSRAAENSRVKDRCIKGTVKKGLLNRSVLKFLNKDILRSLSLDLAEREQFGITQVRSCTGADELCGDFM